MPSAEHALVVDFPQDMVEQPRTVLPPGSVPWLRNPELEYQVQSGPLKAAEGRTVPTQPGWSSTLFRIVLRVPHFFHLASSLAFIALSVEPPQTDSASATAPSPEKRWSGRVVSVNQVYSAAAEQHRRRAAD